MSHLLLTKSLVTPATPASGKANHFIDANGVLKTVNDQGVAWVVGARDLYNWVRNSGFWHAQRQAPGTLTTYSATAGRAFTADGWAVTNENASVQYQRADLALTSEVGTQSRFYGKYTKITATGKMVVSQAILSEDAQNMRGQVVRLTFYLKGIVTVPATWRIGLAQLTAAGTVDSLPATFISAFSANTVDPTLGTNLAYITPLAGQTADNCTIVGNGASCVVSSTTTWTRYSCLFTVPTDCKNLIVMLWSDSQVIATAGIAVSQVQLTEGYEQQVWSPQHYADEFRRLQRFYQKTFGNETAPTAGGGANQGEMAGIAGKAGATALGCQLHWRLSLPLWTTTAVLTGFNPGAAGAQMRDITGIVDTTATALTLLSNVAVRMTATGNAATAVGNQIGLHATVDADF